MTTLKGPGIFLAQFMGDAAPFNSLAEICKWSASLGFTGVQIPTWDSRCIDLQKAAESKDYADEIRGIVQRQDGRSLNCLPICRGSWWQLTRRMILCLMDSRRKMSATIPKPVPSGLCSS